MKLGLILCLILLPLLVFYGCSEGGEKAKEDDKVTAKIDKKKPVDPNQLKLDKKLKSPFLKAVNWNTDYDAVLKLAAKRKLPVLAYFTRSYAP